MLRYDIHKGISKIKTKINVSLQSALMIAGGLGIAVAVPIMAHAANGGASSSNWHVGYYNPGGRALSMSQAMNSLSGLAAFNFTDQANTALLITDQGSQKGSLLGNDSGKTVSATATVSNLNGTFQYYGEPDACGGTTAYVRYFFETSNAGGFDETHYWWSNPVAAPLTTSGTVALTPVTMDGAHWSDFYGHFGTNTNGDSYQGAAGFAAAVSNVTGIGLSFGGGCFFENGVGTSDGSGTFTLNSFNVTP